MNIKTVEISGVTPVAFEGRSGMLYITDRYWWIRNKGDSSIYASLSDDVTAGADGTAEIPAGEVGMLEIDRLHSCIYLNGSGGAEIRTASEPVCPFKSAAKGGDGVSVLFDGDIPVSSGSYAEFDLVRSCSVLIIVPILNNTTTSGTTYAAGNCIVLPVDYAGEEEREFTLYGNPKGTTSVSRGYIKRSGNTFYIRGSSTACSYLTVYGI